MLGLAARQSSLSRWAKRVVPVSTKMLWTPSPPYRSLTQSPLPALYACTSSIAHQSMRNHQAGRTSQYDNAEYNTPVRCATRTMAPPVLPGYTTGGAILLGDATACATERQAFTANGPYPKDRQGLVGDCLPLPTRAIALSAIADKKRLIKPHFHRNWQTILPDLSRSADNDQKGPSGVWLWDPYPATRTLQDSPARCMASSSEDGRTPMEDTQFKAPFGPLNLTV